MQAVVHTFWLQKSGNAPEEYEDACWPASGPSQQVGSLRLAVADGATQASFSGLWAGLLSRAYCLGRLAPERLEAGLLRLQRVWKRCVAKKALPWYAEDKLEYGAFAAIVGLELCSEGRSWSAFAVGDCCVFQARGRQILTRFPLDRPELFDDRPLLLSSLARSNDAAVRSVSRRYGTWAPGDTFYLMSDALAAWFLRVTSLPDGDAACRLGSLTSQAEFTELVELQRRVRLKDGLPMMRNDDVTLLTCTVT